MNQPSSPNNESRPNNEMVTVQLPRESAEAYLFVTEFSDSVALEEGASCLRAALASEGADPRTTQHPVDEERRLVNYLLSRNLMTVELSDAIHDFFDGPAPSPEGDEADLVQRLIEARDLCKAQTAEAHERHADRLRSLAAHFRNQTDRCEREGNEAPDVEDAYPLAVKADAHREAADYLDGTLVLAGLSPAPTSLSEEDRERINEIAEYLENEAMGSGYPQHETLVSDAAFLRNLADRSEQPATEEGLQDRIRAELVSDETGALAGPLGEAIATAAGNYSLEFVTPEQVANGICDWLTPSKRTETTMPDIDWNEPVTVTMRRGRFAAVAQSLGYANNISDEAEQGKREIAVALAQPPTSDQEEGGWPAELWVAVGQDGVEEINWGDEKPEPGMRRYVPALTSDPSVDVEEAENWLLGPGGQVVDGPKVAENVAVVPEYKLNAAEERLREIARGESEPWRRRNAEAVEMARHYFDGRTVVEELATPKPHQGGSDDE